MPPAVLIVALVVLAAVIGFFGWKTIGGGSAQNEKVELNIEQIKKDFQSGGGGMGRRR